MCLVTAIVVAWGMLSMGPVAWADEPGEHHHTSMMPPEKATAAPAAGCPACKRGVEHMKTLAKLKDLLAEAKDAAEAEGAKTAAAKIAEALALIDQQHQAMHEQMARHMQTMHKDMMSTPMTAEQKTAMTCPMCGKMMNSSDGIVNARCPIMGTKLDPAKVPDALTRTFQGQKVGFCCGGCPAAWDKLTDPQKQEKLDAAMGDPEKPEGSAATRATDIDPSQ
jgi:hypothetical protein